MCLKLKENAIFIADSHYNEKRVDFLSFLLKIETKEIVTTQLILMGDIFDFICSQSNFFVNKNKKVINLLNNLSKTIEIIYLEGNHDYNLENLFPKIKVFSRDSQPVIAKVGTKTVSLNHGDLFVDFSYEIYCSVIRNKIFLNFLNLIDINNWLSKKINNHLLSKDICHKIENFEKIAKKRSGYFKEDMVVEGHFHQGKSFIFENIHYINIPSFYCSKKYGVIKDNLIVNIDFY